MPWSTQSYRPRRHCAVQRLVRGASRIPRLDRAFRRTSAAVSPAPYTIDAGHEHQQKEKKPRIRQQCKSTTPFKWRGIFIWEKADHRVGTENKVGTSRLTLKQQIVDEQSNRQPKQSEMVGRSRRGEQ